MTDKPFPEPCRETDEKAHNEDVYRVVDLFSRKPYTPPRKPLEPGEIDTDSIASLRDAMGEALKGVTRGVVIIAYDEEADDYRLWFREPAGSDQREYMRRFIVGLERARQLFMAVESGEVSVIDDDDEDEDE